MIRDSYSASTALDSWIRGNSSSATSRGDDIYCNRIQLLKISMASNRWIGEPLDIQSIVTQLKSELTRIGEVIGLLEGEGNTPAKKRVGRPPGSGAAKAQPRSKGRGITPAGRRKLSEAMKQRWAQRRGPIAVTRTKTAVATAAKPKKSGGITAAGRKKLSEAMKARWAAKKRNNS